MEDISNPRGLSTRGRQPSQQKKDNSFEALFTASQCKGHQACVPAPLPFPLQSRRFRTLLSPNHVPLHIDGEVPSPKSTTSKPSESLRSCNGRDRTPDHLRTGCSPCRIQRVDLLRWRIQSVSSEWGGWGCWRHGPGSERSSLVFSSASSEAAEMEEGEEEAS